MSSALSNSNSEPPSHATVYEAAGSWPPADAIYIWQDDRLVFVNAHGIVQLRAANAEQLIGLPRDAIFGGSLRGGAVSVLRCIDGDLLEVDVANERCQFGGRNAVQMTVRARNVRTGAIDDPARQTDSGQVGIGSDFGTIALTTLLQHEKLLLEMIALDCSLEMILSELCRSVERAFGGITRCSVMLLDADGSRVHVAAGPSLPEPFCAAIDGLPIGPATGSCGTAIFWNRQVVVADILTDPLWEHYRAFAIPYGVRACWSTPVTAASGAVLGAFGVYSDEVWSPTPDQISFVNDTIHLVGVAVHKDRVERSLQESEERHRAVVDNLHEGILVQSRTGVVLTCNPSAERILRIAANSAVGMRRGSYFRRILDIDGTEILPDDLPSMRVLRSGKPILDLVVAIEMMDGDLIWVSENVLPMRYGGEIEPSAVLISFADITAVRSAQERLRFLASHDALTSLPNRAYLNERMRTALDLARRRSGQVALMFLDLDRFKHVNDTIGHDAGDILLRTVAGRLAACMRKGDTLARLGGDEFIVLIELCDDPGYLPKLAEQILGMIGVPFKLQGFDYYLGVSIGISLFPTDGDDGPTLLRAADAAMYLAKQSGRNNMQFYTPALSERIQRRFHLEKNLRHALEHEEFVLHYQPKLDLATGRIVGAEALLRWNSANVGDVGPVEFIPIAEETGLIVQIGQWALEQACHQAAQWRKTLHPELRMAVNLSPRQFYDRDLVQMVRRTLQKTGLPGEALELEITESLLMDDSAELMPVFTSLVDLGVRFSLDDFGTGYSSLSYLQRFPLASLKIDRSFISGIPHHRDSVALTLAIIAMARSLRMTITAEGVEQHNQMEFLKHAGCEEMQGDYFSRPLPAVDFAELSGF